MEEVIENTFFGIIAKIGTGVSWATENIIKWLAQYGYNITILQSKILTFILFGVLIYITIGVLNIGKKIIKWGIVIGAIFLMFSVLMSMFM